MLRLLKTLFAAPVVPQQGAASPMADLRETGRHVVEHVDAMAGLLSVELHEYAARQTKRAVLVAAAAVPACTAWLLLSALAVWLLQPLCGWGWALFAAAALNVLIVAFLAVVAHKCSAGAPAPLTCREMKNDWQCLKLLFNGNKKH